jgi:prepilin-type N-terminal cleavage/methylation domain-containing protein/prepilin-type processing-associated H-X9-DG protein
VLWRNEGFGVGEFSGCESPKKQRRRKMKTKKGFTLVELLVVIAIIAMLMGILMPALARVRQLAFRLVCGTNLSGIGKAMLIYANDYEDELPRAGGRTSTLGRPVNWTAADRNTAYGLNPTDGSGGRATITSCFYLLVKFAEVTPKSFVCKGESGVTEFKLSDEVPPALPANFELIQAWDFGRTTTDDSPAKHCSYSYHQPLPSVAGTYPYALTTSNEPGMAVAADRNPWTPPPGVTIDSAAWNDFLPTGTPEQQKKGNGLAHQGEGQNVLFLDGHVYFERRSYCAIEDDNIYTFWSGTSPNWDKRRGTRPTAAGFRPQGRTDSLLINDRTNSVCCFPPDTLVWVDGALLQISKVVAGQTVGKLNCIAVTASPEQIETVQEHEGAFECRDIVLENGNAIGVVSSHYFLLDNGQWVAALNLKSGLKLQSSNGPIGIKSVVKRAMPLVGKVYDLKVKSSNRYLVGEDGVMVHDY